LEDTVEPFQILKRPTKSSKTVKPVAPLKQTTFRHSIEQQDPFNVVKMLWRTLTNMTFGQLLQDNTYKAEMMKVLEAEKVQALTPRETRITQALKAYIKLKGIPLSVLLDTGASVSAISKDLAQKLQLKVEANDRTRVLPLEGNPKVKVVGLVKEALLLV